jgi:hypothetical protein
MKEMDITPMLYIIEVVIIQHNLHVDISWHVVQLVEFLMLVKFCVKYKNFYPWAFWLSSYLLYISALTFNLNLCAGKTFLHEVIV